MKDYLPGITWSTLLAGRRRWPVLVLLAAFLLAVVRCIVFVSLPYGNGQVVRIVDFPKGSSVKKLAAGLETEKITGSALLLGLYARISGADGKVRAGTYQFSDGMPPGQILRRLVSGDVYEIRFAVPEGYSIFQVAEMLESRGHFGKEAFLKECRNPEILKEGGIPGRTVEGYLYPSTYDLLKARDPADLIRQMVAQFNRTYRDRFAAIEGSTGLNRHQIVTLASIIEKESIVPDEQPVIASVFFNRLKKGMPLQSDPTAVYGTRAFGGKVSAEDVRRSSAYNTYTIRGLPPGPIGNPGAGAIAAVMRPARTDYYYFVAKNDGTHQFSATLDEHNRAVAIYLKSGAARHESPEYRNERQNITGRR